MDKDIILVSEMFYPDKTSTAHIMTKIADKLSQSANITVISGDSFYGGDKFPTIIPTKPYSVIRINSGTLDKNKLVTRTLKMVLTSLRLLFKLFSRIKKGTEVIIVTNPAPFLLLVSILKKIKGFKLNIIVQDVFPENANAAGILSSTSILYKILRKTWESAYSKADRLIVCGRDMKTIFSQKLGKYRTRPEIKVIENWADKNERGTNKDVSISEDGIKVLFAGNIGRCQGIESFLTILREGVIENIAVEFRGDGAVVPFIKDFINNNPQLNLTYGGRYCRDEQFDILEACDIALVTLTDGMLGLGVPSKSYNIMAAGKPILYIGDVKSEIAMVIKEYDIGYCFEPRDRNGINHWLKSLNNSMRKEFHDKGLKAKQLAETIFSEETILDKYSTLFSNK